MVTGNAKATVRGIGVEVSKVSLLPRLQETVSQSARIISSLERMKAVLSGECDDALTEGEEKLSSTSIEAEMKALEGNLNHIESLLKGFTQYIS